MRSPILALFLAFVVSQTAACGRPTQDSSRQETIRETQTSMTDTGPLLRFIASAQGVLASETHSGVIPASQFVDMMPLHPADRQRLTQAFPGNFEVTCRDTICSATTAGRRTDVTLQGSVRIVFLITNPTMSVDDAITTDFVLRGDNAVEFCRTRGLMVSSRRFSRTIYGLVDRVRGGRPQLDVSDEDGDLNCR